MALFEFELAAVEKIAPWEGADGPSLSWFALTDGLFHMPVGGQVLFRYTQEILRHWGVIPEGHWGQEKQAHPDYQIAAFARDVLGSVAAGMAPLPPLLEKLAADWRLLRALMDHEPDDAEREELDHAAWRWVGERSPWMSYLTAAPKFCFVRVGECVHICWDNRSRSVDEIPVWAAQEGVHSLPAEAFLSECRSFAERLLDEMAIRIDAIEAGTARAQIKLDVSSLRRQQEEWTSEFESYFRSYEPDIPWVEAEAAVRAIAESAGVALPDP